MAAVRRTMAGKAAFPLMLGILVLLDILFGLGAAYVFTLNADIHHTIEISSRILGGEVPYRDFVPLYGPLFFYWTTFWYWLLGANSFAGYFEHCAASAATATLLIGLVSLLLFNQTRVRLAFVATAWLLVLHRISTLRIWLPLSAAALAIHSAETGNKRRFFLSCVLAGTGLLISPEAGLAASVACIVCSAERAWKSREPARRWIAPLTGILAGPAIYFLAFPDAAVLYIRTVSGLAVTADWFMGLPLIPGRQSLEMVMYFFPFAVTASVVLQSINALVKSSPDRMPAGAAGNLAMAAFSVILLRTALGRCDYAHLLFALPPALILCFRIWDRRPSLAPLLLAAIIPFLVVNGRYGILVNSISLFDARSPSDLFPINGSGMFSRPATVARTGKVVAVMNELSGPGEAVLSLPYGVFNQLGRRPYILPVTLLDHLRILPELSAWSVNNMEKRSVRLVMFEPGLSVAVNPALVHPGDPLNGRISWVTEADEAITRDFKEYLRRNFAFKKEVGGVRFYLRRSPPLPRRQEHGLLSISPSMKEARILLEGQDLVIPIPGVACDEVRIGLKCRYFPGLASLAKTRLSISYAGQDGLAQGGEIPVPPAQLGLDIRFSPPAVPLRSLLLRLSNPGLLNPRPNSVEIKSIRLIRFRD